MEARAEYLGRVERPRLTVVKDGGVQGRFSALPHAVLFSDLSDGEVRVYAAVQSYIFGPDGECTASHESIAEKIGKEVRTVRRLLKDLVGKGYLTERRAGRGQAKAYRCPTITTGQNRPVESGQDRPVSEPKRPKTATQQAKIGQFNRPKLAAPIEEDSFKKNPPEEEDSSSAPPEPAPKPTRSGQLIDALKAADIPVTMRPQDHKALKDSGADPLLVAEAYGALFRGEWGDDFMRRSLSVQFVIGRLAAYQSWKRDPRPAQRNGAGTIPPGATSKQKSWWTDDDVRRKFRVASNVDPQP